MPYCIIKSIFVNFYEEKGLAKEKHNLYNYYSQILSIFINQVCENERIKVIAKMIIAFVLISNYNADIMCLYY